MSTNQSSPSPAQDHQLQTNRSVMMDRLYKMSGRTSGHYTGLWQEWAINLANTLRDASAMTK